MWSEGFESCLLKDYLSAPIRNGFSPVESPSWTGVQMLGLGCLTVDGFQPRQLKHAPSFVSVDHPALLHEGDVLMSRANTRELVGLVGMYSDVGSPCIYPDLMMRLRPGGNCLPRFLEVLLCSNDTRKRLVALAQGTSESMVKISAATVEKLKVALVPLREQYRIVEALDAIAARLSAVEEELRKAHLVWDGVLNRELDEHVQHYKVRRLRDVSRHGASYGSNEAAIEHSLKLPRYVRITDIDDDGSLSPDLSAAASLPWRAARRYLLDEGDLLIARTGFTTGKSYLYRSSDGVCAYAGYLVRFKFNSRVIMPEYAFLWTKGRRFLSWVSANVREVGQRNISASEYNEHEIATPPLDVQLKLVKAWRAAREARCWGQREIERLHTLRRAIADDLVTGRVRVGDVAWVYT